MHKKHHLHHSCVLGSLLAAGGNIHHARAHVWHVEGFGVAKGGPWDFPSLDRAGRYSNLLVCNINLDGFDRWPELELVTWMPDDDAGADCAFVCLPGVQVLVMCGRFNVAVRLGLCPWLTCRASPYDELIFGKRHVLSHQWFLCVFYPPGILGNLMGDAIHRARKQLSYLISVAVAEGGLFSSPLFLYCFWLLVMLTPVILLLVWAAESKKIDEAKSEYCWAAGRRVRTLHM